jgi:hypothetical protein
MTTEDFAEHDRCPRFHAYSSRYAPFRVSFHYALNEALNAAIVANDPILASERVLALAANPGIDFKSSNLYSSVVHHSRLAEVLAAYCLSIESCLHPPIPTKWGSFTPQSFLLPDGRLRRIVLTDRWTPEREQMERFSWRTVADTAITNRPMVITAILIGSLRDGYRPSQWTQGFLHPQNGNLRISKRKGEFSESWKKVYREQSGLSALEWLKIMQDDGAFDDAVFSVTEDVPKNREEILSQMAEMAKEMTSPSPRQTRSACYRFTPCPFLPACATSQSPAALGWAEKDIPAELTMLH